MQIRKKLLIVAVVMFAIALVLPPNASIIEASAPASHTSGQVRSFTVIVSEHGFNGTDKTLFLNLMQGDAVHFTFLYGDSELPYDNPHVVFVEGYDIRTSVISKSNPSATLDFIATETGTFAFYCLIPCEGMVNLSSGAILVAPRTPGSMPTALEVTMDGATVQGQLVDIVAMLTQGSQPVSNARVDFYVNTTFGQMKAGTAVTDEKGVAQIGFRFTGSGPLAVIVTCAGTESLAPSSRQLNVFVEPRLEGPSTPNVLPDGSAETLPRLPYARGQNLMPDVRLVGVPFSQSLPIITLILLIVGSVWAAYGYVFAQIRAIKSETRPEQEGKERSEARLESTSARKGFDKRLLVGAVLVIIVLAGVFAYYQLGTAPQGMSKTETVNIDIKMLMQNGGERHIFDPATITVHKGNHIVLIVTNTDDDAIHGVVIPELGLTTEPLSFNQQAKLEFDADTVGTFTILCSVPGCAPDHAQMISQLIVVT